MNSERLLQSSPRQFRTRGQICPFPPLSTSTVKLPHGATGRLTGGHGRQESLPPLRSYQWWVIAFWWNKDPTHPKSKISGGFPGALLFHNKKSQPFLTLMRLRTIGIKGEYTIVLNCAGSNGYRIWIFALGIYKISLKNFSLEMRKTPIKSRFFAGHLFCCPLMVRVFIRDFIKSQPAPAHRFDSHIRFLPKTSLSW